jgi:ABC-type phosphate transport system substrate-binding protein
VALLFLLLSLAWVPVSALAGSVEIIVSPDQANTQIDRTLLRAMFSMRVRQWPDGTPVRVFVLPDHDEATALFCREQLGTYPYVMRSTWDRMVFTGTGLAPTVVGSEREMRERVRSTPGAIGYVRSADTSDTRRSLPRLLVAALPGQPHG